MRLKILVFPFAILLALFLVIGYIKPDIDVVQDKRLTLETKTAQSANMATLLSNIDVLTSALNEQSESERLVQTFLPKTSDQERVIDTFNYLASQSGVAVSVMDMKEILVKNTETEVLPDPAVATDASGVLPPPQSLKPKVQAYTASVSVRGGYDNIKDFFNRLSHTNRFHQILNFTVTAAAGEEAASTPGLLSATFESQFDYFPDQKLDSALNVPVFMKGGFDSVQMEMLKKWVNYTVPPLSKPVTGRPSPFQP